MKFYRSPYRIMPGLLFAALALLLMSTTLVFAQDATPPVTGAEDIAQDLVDITEGAAEGTVATVDTLISNLIQPPRSDIARLLLIVGGVLLLVAGWRFYEYIILIAGMIIGATVALSLITTNSVIIAVLVMLVGAVIGAILSVFLYYVAVFLIGAYVGIILTGTVAAALSLTPVSPIALLIGAIIGGLIMLAVSIEFLILVSAIVGAQMLVLGLGLGAVWILIFAVFGIILQLVLTRAFRYEFRRRPRRINLLRRAT